jgi:hypothetical protein
MTQTQHPQHRLKRWLTLSGTLPFIGAAISVYVLPNDLANLSLSFVAVYGAVIISFLCGMHWGLYLYKYDQIGPNLFLESNIIALLAWVSVLLGQISIALCFGMQVCLFAYLLWTDRNRLSSDIIRPAFYDLRLMATLIVVISLLALMVNRLAFS